MIAQINLQLFAIKDKRLCTYNKHVSYYKGDTDHHYDTFEVPVKRSNTVYSYTRYIHMQAISHIN
jgi:hypothetical protein